jgi:hypothetical protein
MEYLILKAFVNGEFKTVLIAKDEYEGSPKDYFFGAPSNAKKVGVVEIEGDTEELNGWYESC